MRSAPILFKVRQEWETDILFCLALVENYSLALLILLIKSIDCLESQYEFTQRCWIPFQQSPLLQTGFQWYLYVSCTGTRTSNTMNIKFCLSKDHKDNLIIVWWKRMYPMVSMSSVITKLALYSINVLCASGDLVYPVNRWNGPGVISGVMSCVMDLLTKGPLVHNNSSIITQPHHLHL